MGKIYDEIDQTLERFILTQHVFFVSTAPAGSDGHINLSPKGLDSIRLLDPHTLAYLDYVGSGAETIAHLRENGRVVVMWCAFDGPPRIVRVHGHGTVVEPQDPAFGELRTLFADGPGVRAVIRIAIDRISDSCGFGVPRYAFEADRSQLPAWASRKTGNELVDYQLKKNRTSIDELPALRWTDGDGS
jgi:hypothetical protein